MQMPTSTQNGKTVFELVGNTPLVRLTRVTANLGPIEIYGKAEYMNPGGSVKDRPGLNMVLDGERSGKLTKDKIVLDATSGNTGIAYAWICAARGYKVMLCLPKNASEERKRILAAYGAELVLTSPFEGSDGAIKEARRLYAENPELYFYPDQYNNPANWQSHYETTAPEIYQQTDGRITHFVAGLGTSGTFVGTAKKLRELNSQIKLISMQPDSPFHGLEGMKHMASAIVPGIYDATIADAEMEVSTEDAHRMVRRLAREEGLFVGISSGANVHAAMEIAKGLESGVIVTILCDDGSKYLTDKFWNEV